MKRPVCLFTTAFVAASLVLSAGAVAQATPRHSDRPIPIDQALFHLNLNFKLTPISRFIVILAHDIECEAGLIQCHVPMAKPGPVTPAKPTTPTTAPPVIVVIPPVAVSVPVVAVNVSVPPVAISVTPVTTPPMVTPLAATTPTTSITSTCSVTNTNGGEAQCSQSSTVSAQS